MILNMDNELIPKTGVLDIKREETEIFYDIKDEIEEENNSNIVRFEMTVLRFPFFTYSKKYLKKNRVLNYSFSKERDEYLKIVPGMDRSVPGEVEEKIYFALTIILKRNGYANPFYTTPKEIADIINITYKGYAKKITEGLYKLSTTTYEYKNLFKPTENNNLKSEGAYKIIDFTAYTRAEVDKNILGEINDRSQTIYKVSFANDFYKNILESGYLALDSEKILKIKKTTARKLYSLLEVHRFYKLEYTASSRFLAAKIPLVWSPNQYSQTVKAIKEAAEYLKNEEYLENFIFNSEKGNGKSYFTFYYDSDKHNKEKKIGYYEDRAEFSQFAEELEAKGYSVKIASEYNINNLSVDAQKIFDIMPDNAKNYAGLIKLVNDVISKYGYYYVEYIALKMRNNGKKIKFPLKFFKVLLNDKAIHLEASKYTENKRIENENIIKAEKIEEKTKLVASFYSFNKEKQEDLLNKYLSSFGLGRKAIEKALNIESSRDDIIIDLMEKLKEAENQLAEKKKKTLQKKSKSSKVANEIAKETEIENIEPIDQEIKKEVVNSEELLYDLEEKFTSITSFAMKILEILEKLEIKSSNKVLSVLKIFEEFDDIIENYKLELKYNSDEKSYIKIKKA